VTSTLNNKTILLGVSGGIAAYKACDLASKLTGAGAAVRTVMTENACRLISPKSFEAVTGQPVYTSLWNEPGEHSMGHISLADWAQAVIVAPATANIIAKAAHGICDDLLSTTLCVCWETPMLFAPAMNTRMWHNPVVRKNIEAIIERGANIVGPGEGRLACGTSGPGRMIEPEMLVASVQKLLSQ
jgi:phosphopantothenoylcysteine decarboxylase/phosphopantothenate--cysteine ligase